MKLVIHMMVQHHIPLIQIFQGSKLHIGINVSTYNLKAQSTPLNGASISVISSITTSFSFRNMSQNDYSVRTSTQFQSLKTFPGDRINL